MGCADAEGNDVVRGSGRIDLCGGLIFGAAPVDAAAARDIYDEVKTTCSGLRRWHMDNFAHGESSCEDIVTGFLRRHKAALSGTSSGGGICSGGPVMVPSYGSAEIKATRANGSSRDMGDWAPGGGTALGSFAAKTVCAGCGKEFISTMLCSRCKLARYCGAECQKAHWPGHKKACFAAAPPAAAKAEEEKKKKREKKGK